MNNYLKFLISLLVPLIVGGISGGFTVSGINGWYATINKLCGCVEFCHMEIELI
jgi:hypothetical protein